MPQALVERAQAFWGKPTLTAATSKALHAAAKRALAAGAAATRAGDRRDAGVRRERPSLPRRDGTGDAGRMTTLADCCNDFSRSRLLRRAVAEAGRGLPRSSPACRFPAGTGHDAPHLRLGCRGPRGQRVRRQPARPAVPRRRHREAPRPTRPAASSSRSSWTAAPTALSILVPGGRPAVPVVPADTCPRPGERHPVRNRPDPPLASGGRVARDAARGGQAHGLPRRRLHAAPTARTSRPGTTGRSARRRSACARAGSAATSTASERRTTRSRA